MPTFTLDLTCDEAALGPLADLIAADLRPGSAVALSGDLGAGKTTLARAIIRSALGKASAEVPSPTFSLVQTYDAPRVRIAHFDLYRLSGADEAAETGFEEAISAGVVLVEWPERAPSLLPDDLLEVKLSAVDGGLERSIRLTGRGAWSGRLERIAAVRRFLENVGWSSARWTVLPGDASTRRYLRSLGAPAPALLMDAPRQPDGPPVRNGQPYSRIAHLAEDVRPFVAVAEHLRGQHLSAPAILAFDYDAGLLLIEDLGDRVFGEELLRGADQGELWRAGIDALLAMRRTRCPSELPLPGGEPYALPRYDAAAMQIEVELLVDWYLPALTGAAVPPQVRSDFIAAWRDVFDRVLAMPKSLVLRDYHSPNLIVLPERRGPARVGLIDFQDAVVGHAAYDLVSLLQDARLDVPEALEKELLGYYLDRAGAAEPDFDAGQFALAFRALGAQRNTKILGIFTRLAFRDGKPRYLAHIPRIWRYLERDLAHAGLQGIKSWYDAHVPADLRQRNLHA